MDRIRGFMSLEEFKNKLIYFIKSYYTNNIIYPSYNLIKQINYANNVIVDGKQDMIDFISEKRNKILELESIIQSMQNLDLLNNFTKNCNDSENIQYVMNNIQNIDEEQAQSVSFGLMVLK